MPPPTQRACLPEAAPAFTKRGPMSFALRMRSAAVSVLLGVASLGLTSAGLVGCGASQSGHALSYGESARRDYERALSAFHDRDCITATPLFQHVRREYPYSRYAALAELRSADCELEQQHYTEAIRQYQAFVRARPTHADVDYAQYRAAVGYFRQIPQDFFLSPPREERDQGATRSALRVIDRFLRDHEDSEHAAEARRMRQEVLALLARHELYVADFYLFRDQPRATISRIEGMLRDYRGSGLEPLALVLLGRTYLRLGERGNARTAFEGVLADYPESGFAEQARNYLDRLELRGEAPGEVTPPAARAPRSPAPTPASDDEGAEVEVEPEPELEAASPEEDAPSAAIDDDDGAPGEDGGEASTLRDQGEE